MQQPNMKKTQNSQRQSHIHPLILYFSLTFSMRLRTKKLKKVDFAVAASYSVIERNTTEQEKDMHFFDFKQAHAIRKSAERATLRHGLSNADANCVIRDAMIEWISGASAAWAIQLANRRACEFSRRAAA